MAVTRFAAVVGIALLIGSRVTVAHEFHIEAGILRYTVNEWSRQSAIQVMYDFDGVGSLHTRAVEGELESDQALEFLLDGTGLAFDRVNELTMAIFPKPEDPPDPRMISKLLRQFEPVAQPWAEGAGPSPAPLTVEVALTGERYAAR